jgi:hypothetical protein
MMRRIKVFFLVVGCFLIGNEVRSSAAFPLTKEVLSLPMSAGYWPHRQMTLEEALVTATVSEISSYSVDAALSSTHIRKDYYGKWFFIAGKCLEELKKSGEDQRGNLEASLINFQEWGKRGSQEGNGLRGFCLEEFRNELAMMSGMTQAHFDWIQRHKGDFSIVSHINSFIEEYYESGGAGEAVEGCFSYVDKQLTEERESRR